MRCSFALKSFTISLIKLSICSGPENCDLNIFKTTSQPKIIGDPCLAYCRLSASRPHIPGAWRLGAGVGGLSGGWAGGERVFYSPLSVGGPLPGGLSLITVQAGHSLTLTCERNEERESYLLGAGILVVSSDWFLILRYPWQFAFNP